MLRSFRRSPPPKMPPIKFAMPPIAPVTIENGLVISIDANESNAPINPSTSAGTSTPIFPNMPETAPISWEVSAAAACAFCHAFCFFVIAFSSA